MDDVAPFKKRDLHQIAGEYLAGTIGFKLFRANMLRCWYGLSRMALSGSERQAWSELIMALRSADHEPPVGQPKATLHDEEFFREALPTLVRMEKDAPVQPGVKRAREIQRALGEVLLNEWDPIGVKDVPEAADEYDSYVGGIYRLLVSDVSDEEIARHLARIEVGMGFGRSPDALLPVVKRLRSVRLQL